MNHHELSYLVLRCLESWIILRNSYKLSKKIHDLSWIVMHCHEVHKYTKKVNKYTSTQWCKYPGIIICNRPICLIFWDIVLIQKIYCRSDANIWVHNSQKQSWILNDHKIGSTIILWWSVLPWLGLRGYG